MDPRVLQAMMPYMTFEFGNPGSRHVYGKTAKEAVDRARQQVADFFHCRPDQVVFTSGGSEGNNLVIKGLKQELIHRGETTILVSAVEHDSVLNAAKDMCMFNAGFDCRLIQPRTTGNPGMIGMPEVYDTLTSDTGLVSVMAVNNETGVVNDTIDIGHYCKDHGILFHIDAVQAAGVEELDTENVFPCDFMTISSHKIHGPKGMGALFIRDTSLLNPLISGGSAQEFGLRGGTENVAGIVGFGEACELTQKDLHRHFLQMETEHQFLRNSLAEQAKAAGLQMVIHGNPNNISPKTLNIAFPGIDAETMLIMLNMRNVCCSAGSACTAHENAPSHVLTAMGVDPEEARCSIRLSISHTTRHEELEEAVMTIIECASAIKAMQNG